MDGKSIVSRAVLAAVALAGLGAAPMRLPIPAATSAPVPLPTGVPVVPRTEQSQIIISGWSLDCSSVATTRQCMVRNQVVVRASAAVISAISIRKETSNAAPLAIVQIPLGTSLDDAVRLGFQNGAEQRLPVHTCNRSGCFASDRLGQPIVAALRAAKEPLRIAYATLSQKGIKQTVTISLGLDGFNSAYARLR